MNSARRFLRLLVVSLVAASCVGYQKIQVPQAAATCRSAVGATGLPIDVSVQWHATSDDDATALDAWCRAVGPVVVTATPSPTSARPATDDATLTVATWNTHVGGGDLRGFIGALRRGDLTEGKVGDFAILLQEVFRAGTGVPVKMPPGAASPGSIVPNAPSRTENEIVQIARDLGLALYYVPSMRNGKDSVGGKPEDRGNAILSTLPLSDFEAIELPFERQRRVAITATIHVEDGQGRPTPLRLASAHLDATAGPQRLWVFASGLRDKQARRLLSALDDGTPTVLGSDLNTWSDGAREPAVATLHRAFPDTALGSTPTFRFGFQLDYLFLRLDDDWRSTSRAVSSTFGSDHRPLVGEIRLN